MIQTLEKDELKWNENTGIDTPPAKPEACSTTTSTNTPQLIRPRTSNSTLLLLPPPSSHLRPRTPPLTSTDLRH